MTINTLKWAPVAIPLSYLVAAHLAFTQRSSGFAALAVAVLVMAALATCRGRHAWWLRAFIAVAGGALVVAIAREAAPPVVLFLPPVAVPLGMAWLFGHTLLRGRMPLVERMAHVFHAPEILDEELLRYTRRVTWAWALLLAALALANLVLVANLSPGGLFELAGMAVPWPVAATTYTWLSNVGTYLLIGGMFVAEFAIRLVRFPNYRFRNPALFIARARARMPEIMRNFRGG
jgi:uncharacterized membrane protein